MVGARVRHQPGDARAHGAADPELGHAPPENRADHQRQRVGVHRDDLGREDHLQEIKNNFIKYK